MGDSAADRIRDNINLDVFLGIVPGERWPRNTQSMGRHQMDRMTEDDAKKLLREIYGIDIDTDGWVSVEDMLPPEGREDVEIRWSEVGSAKGGVPTNWRFVTTDRTVL